MTLRLPPLDDVRVFEAAARLGNFSRAADELAVTQSAVSRRIQHLEAQLGAPLFVRRGPRIELTDRGREYLGVVQEGLGVIRRGTQRLFRRDATPTLTVSTVPSIVSRWLVPRLHDFERLHPEISLHLSATFRLVDLHATDEVDAAIRFGRGVWPGLAAERILEDVVFPVCSADLARRLKKPRDLLKQRLLGEDPHYDLWNVWLEAAGIHAPPPSPDRLSDDFSVQLQAAVLGRGVCLTRGILAADDLREGRLVCPFPILAACPLQFYFVCLPERFEEPALARFRQWLTRTAERTVEGLRELVCTRDSSRNFTKR